MMYYVYKLTFGNKELLGSFEDRMEAARFESKMRSEIRKGNNRDGAYADVTMYSEEELARTEYTKQHLDELTEEEKKDIIEVDGRRCIRKIYEEVHKNYA